jgi:hypothetical protein
MDASITPRRVIVLAHPTPSRQGALEVVAVRPGAVTRII